MPESLDIGLVEFSCGCIGIVSKDNSQAVMVSYCDDDDEYVVQLANEERASSLLEKARTPVPPEEQAQMVKALGELVWEGYKYRNIKRALQ